MKPRPISSSQFFGSTLIVGSFVSIVGYRVWIDNVLPRLHGEYGKAKITYFSPYYSEGSYSFVPHVDLDCGGSRYVGPKISGWRKMSSKQSGRIYEPKADHYPVIGETYTVLCNQEQPKYFIWHDENIQEGVIQHRVLPIILVLLSLYIVGKLYRGYLQSEQL